jgi:D-tyrosyl-tRNA(Tyr) deacylase
VRAVVQRVSRASVRVDGESIAAIDRGLLVLLGVGQGDGPTQAAELAKRIVHLRIFPDDEGRMNRSLIDTGGALAVVSQFTLYGDARKGRRPYFGDAAAPEVAEPLVDAVAEAAREFGVEVKTGRFQAHMEVNLTNDGPVTILLDSEKTF